MYQKGYEFHTIHFNKIKTFIKCAFVYFVFHISNCCKLKKRKYLLAPEFMYIDTFKVVERVFPILNCIIKLE